MKYLKSYNESIRHLLKPKNDEEINKKLDNLNPQQKLEKGCEYDQLWLVKMALKEGADPSDNYNYPITISVVNDSIDVVKFLLKDNRVDPSDGNDMCIRHATTYSNIDMVKELLKHPKVNPFHSTKVEFVENVIKSAFQIAVEDNDIELIQLFLNDYRAKKYLSEDFYNKNIKYYFNKNESIRHLLKGKDLNDVLKNNEIKPLNKIASGCQYGILSLVKDTIEDKEFNINDLNGFDFIIYSATINNHIDIVEYLLKNTNLDPTIYNNASIENAYINDNVEMVELLLNDDRVRNSLPKFKVNDYELLIYKNKKTK